MSSSARPLVVVAGGGTAGHTNPGIAVAQALVARGLGPEQVRFIGGERGNESELVPAAGFAIDVLPGRGIERSLTARNLGSVTSLAAGAARAQRLIARYRPAAVLCLGGYAAFGPSAAAVLQRRPVVVSEQNAVPSVVNEAIGRFAAACAVPFEGCDLPRAEVTGNPVRAEVTDALSGLDRDAARARLGVAPGRVLVASWAGSLGATALNQAVADLAERWSGRRDLELYHVVGARDWDRFGREPDVGAAAGLRYRTVRYEYEMPTLLRAADVVVCRAGASTVAEVAAAGVPSVLVPLPGAPRDHQTRNARVLEAAGGAHLLPQAELTGERLGELLDGLVADPRARHDLAEAARSVGRPDAAAAVAEILAREGGFA